MITLATLGGVIGSLALGIVLGFIGGYYVCKKWGSDPNAL